MCIKAFDENPRMLRYVPDCFKTREMCERAVEEGLWSLLVHIPDQYNTQTLCDETVGNDTRQLRHVLDIFKIQEMCIKAVDCTAHSSWSMFLIVLKPKKYVIRQCATIHA